MSSTLAYDLQIEVRQGYIHACVTVDNADRAIAMSFLSDALIECAKHRRKRLLLERASAGSVAENELFYIMDDLVKMNDQTKIAFLNRHLLLAEELRDVVAYGAEIGGNYRCFNSFQEAEEWLLQDIED